MTAQNDRAFAEEPQPARAPGPADEHAPTVRLAPTDAHRPSGDHGPSGGHGRFDDRGCSGTGYSATVLAGHWVQGPEPDDTDALVEQPVTEVTRVPPPTRPDRVEGTVLRFGPGVTAAALRTRGTPPAALPAPAPPRRRPRRHALPALVLVCVLAFLAWQRLGPSVAVRTVAVTARPTAVGCDGTADIVGLVTTDGRPGTLSYRWIRSDGTASGVLREAVVRGQRQARLHLLWTLQGKGRYPARAELRILAPAHRTAAVRLTYDCS
jgi:hypothetical protein